MSHTVGAWWASLCAEGARELATQGIYARLRHPQYAGFIAITFGFLVQWRTIFILAMLPVLVTLYLRLAVGEGRQAEQEFGQVWRGYAAHTPRFLPRFIGSAQASAT